MIVSAGVMVGCVMYFVLKNTVSDTLLLFVCLTYISCGIGNVLEMSVSTIRLSMFWPMMLHVYCFGVIVLHIPLVLGAFCCN